MRKMFILGSLFCFFSFFGLAQKMLNEKVLYETPGVNTNLINFYGGVVIDKFGGTISNHQGTPVTDVIDLGENGFLFRKNLSLIYFRNTFEKVGEFDLTEFYNKKGADIQYTVGKDGVLLYQGMYSSAPKGVKFILLSYTGKISTGVVVPQVKDITLAFALKAKDGFMIWSTTDEKKYSSLIYMDGRQKDISDDEAEKQGEDDEPDFLDSEDWNKRLNLGEKGFFLLSKINKAGSIHFQVAKRSGVSYEGDINLPEVAGSKTYATLWVDDVAHGRCFEADRSEREKVEAKIKSMGRIEEAIDLETISIYNERTNTVYLLYNLYKEGTILFIAIDLTDKKVIKKYYNEDVLKQLGINTADLQEYTFLKYIDCPEGKYAETFENGLGLILHRRMFSIDLAPGRKVYYFSFDNNGSLKSVAKHDYNHNFMRNHDYWFNIQKSESIYRKSGDDILDLAYSKANPGDETLFRVLRRSDGYLVFKMEGKDSRLTCYKVSY